MTLNESMYSALDADLDAEFARAFEYDDDGAVDATVEVGSQFQIADDAQADWALRKISAAESEIAKITKLADEEINKIIAWRVAEVTKHQRTADFMAQLLGTYHRKLFAEDATRKTIKLPHGTLMARAGQTKFTFTPEFVEWARINAPDMLRVKYETDAVKAKNTFDVVENLDHEFAAVWAGEVVPGVEIEPATTKFSQKAETRS